MKAYLGDKLVVEGSLAVIGSQGYTCDRIEIYAKDARWLASIAAKMPICNERAILLQLANRFTENRAGS